MEHGFHVTEGGRKLFYSIYLKPENKGQRDNRLSILYIFSEILVRWLFIEVLRNMNPEFRPKFTAFMDSDTFITSNAIRLLSVGNFD